MNKQRKTIWLLALCFLMAGGPAHAQQDAVQWYPSSGTAVAPPSSTQANIELRLSQMEMEIRSLTGQLEQQNFEIRKLHGMIGQLATNLETGGTATDFRTQLDSGQAAAVAPGAGAQQQMTGGQLQGLNTRYTPQYVPPSVPPVQTAGSGSVQVSSLSGGGDTYMRSGGGTSTSMPSTSQLLGTFVQDGSEGGTEAVAPIHDDPTSAYEYAFTLLRGKNYEEAEMAFRSFLEYYGDHILAANAKYWLGETFYVRGDYERAARIFAEAYQEGPKSAKGPDNLLKLGMSLAGMGKTQDSCLTLAQLTREYSRGAKPVLGRAQQEMDRIGCGSTQ